MSNKELTPRELNVLRSYGNGLSKRQTAKSLSISTQDVFDDVLSIVRKLGVGTRMAAMPAAVAEARRRGLIS